MAQKIQIRHDTAANWTSVNPVLMVGEQGYETDTGKSKIGDGGTSWTALSYVSVPSFTGSLAGDVTGTQGATVVSTVGGSTAANVHAAEVLANAATNAATASVIMKRDSNANVAINNINEAFATTATAAGTTTLAVSSAPLQQFTGTTTQAVNLPDATTLPVGCQYYVFNRSTGVVTVKDGSVSHATVQAISGGGQCCFTLAANGTAAGTWDTTYTYTGTLPISLGGTGQTSATAAFDAFSPCTTTGDVIYYNGTHNARLGIGSSGQVLGISGGVPAWTTPSTGELSNKLLNSDFRFWQATTAPAALVWSTGGTFQYGPDQWYARNALNGGTTAGQLTFTRTTGSLNGSLYGCQLKITTAPVGTPANGCELYQVLENVESLPLYGQTASFGINVKALGNVTQVGIQFVYMTSETKATGATVIGSETLTTVNSSTFTLCQILGQALGTSMTTAGIIGVRIRITAVSTGNTYDLNNGFIVEQAMLNLGSTLGAWKRNGPSFAAELVSLQRFYEKTFLVDTNPAANITATTSATTAMYFSTTAARTAGIPFKATKRANSTMTFYSTQSASTGAADYISISGSATTNAGINNILAQVGQAGFDLPSLATGSIAQCIYVTCNWVADARI